MAVDFNKIKDDIISVGKEVSNTAKDATDLAKTKLDIRAKEDFLEKQYALLGKLYFEEHMDDEDLADNENFKTIREARAQLEELNGKVLDKKGAVVCENCGEKQSASSNYCNKMGKRFKKESRAVSPLTFSETDATFKKANIIVKHVEKESTFVKALQRSSY